MWLPAATPALVRLRRRTRAEAHLAGHEVADPISHSRDHAARKERPDHDRRENQGADLDETSLERRQRATDKASDDELDIIGDPARTTTEAEADARPSAPSISCRTRGAGWTRRGLGSHRARAVAGGIPATTPERLTRRPVRALHHRPLAAGTRWAGGGHARSVASRGPCERRHGGAGRIRHDVVMVPV